ncbi:hypothetical protein STEG23_004933 [Scotinomys teguina]
MPVFYIPDNLNSASVQDFKFLENADVFGIQLSILLGFVGGFISFIKCQSTIEGLDSISLVTLSRVTVSAIVFFTPEAIGPLPVQLPSKRRAPYPFQIAKVTCTMVPFCPGLRKGLLLKLQPPCLGKDW